VKHSRPTRYSWAPVIALALVAGTLLACDDGNRNATDASGFTQGPSISAADAERRLASIVLVLEDLGDGYRQDVARVITNDQAAHARADTAFANEQYEAWGQVLSYNVQFSRSTIRDAVNTPAHTRVMNNATIYNDADGAATAMVYLRALPVELLENILTNEGAGTRISDTSVQRDIAFPQRGDELYALRASGKATIDGRLTVAFVADTVFVRAGNINGAVTAVALGDTPDRAELERLVDRFVEKARAA
jgi:hypothetical protein